MWWVDDNDEQRDRQFTVWPVRRQDRGACGDWWARKLNFGSPFDYSRYTFTNPLIALCLVALCHKQWWMIENSSRIVWKVWSTHLEVTECLIKSLYLVISFENVTHGKDGLYCTYLIISSANVTGEGQLQKEEKKMWSEETGRQDRENEKLKVINNAHVNAICKMKRKTREIRKIWTWRKEGKRYSWNIVKEIEYVHMYIRPYIDD